MHVDNLQDLTNGPSSSYLTLLNIFAFGNYKSLLECTEPLPEVTETMRRKLRLLTVVSLAEQNKMLAYNLLMSELDINTVRELEDLVIEGISGENNNAQWASTGGHIAYFKKNIYFFLNFSCFILLFNIIFQIKLDSKEAPSC